MIAESLIDQKMTIISMLNRYIEKMAVFAYRKKIMDYTSSHQLGQKFGSSDIGGRINLHDKGDC